MGKWILAAALSAILSACATSPYAVSKTGPEGIKKVPTVKLCDTYRFNNQANLLVEIGDRHEFSDEDFAALSTHSMHIGMTAAAARCSWGDAYFIAPGTRGTDMEKWVYWQSKAYLFIKDGMVVNFEP